MYDFCQYCERYLKDPESRKLGSGSTCRKRESDRILEELRKIRIAAKAARDNFDRAYLIVLFKEPIADIEKSIADFYGDPRYLNERLEAVKTILKKKGSTNGQN